MSKLILPPIRKNEKHHESAWDTRDMPYKGDIICKEIKDGMPSVMQEEVEENVGSKYQTIPPPKNGSIFLGTYRPWITGGAQIVDPRSPLSKIRRLIILMGLMLTVSRSLGLLLQEAKY